MKQFVLDTFNEILSKCIALVMVVSTRRLESKVGNTAANLLKRELYSKVLFLKSCIS